MRICMDQKNKGAFLILHTVRFFSDKLFIHCLPLISLLTVV